MKINTTVMPKNYMKIKENNVQQNNMLNLQNNNADLVSFTGRSKCVVDFFNNHKIGLGKTLIWGAITLASYQYMKSDLHTNEKYENLVSYKDPEMVRMIDIYKAHPNSMLYSMLQEIASAEINFDNHKITMDDVTFENGRTMRAEGTVDGKENLFSVDLMRKWKEGEHTISVTGYTDVGKNFEITRDVTVAKAGTDIYLTVGNEEMDTKITYEGIDIQNKSGTMTGKFKFVNKSKMTGNDILKFMKKVLFGVLSIFTLCKLGIALYRDDND